MVIVCFVVGIFGFWTHIANNTDLYCFNTLFPSAEDVESRAFFKLPPSAHQLEYTAAKALPDMLDDSCTIWVTFEMDPDDFQHFQKSIQLAPLEQGQVRTDYFLYPLMEQKAWKTPESFVSSYGLVGKPYPFIRQIVVVDTTNLAQLKVYIITYNPCPRPASVCTIPL